MCPLAGTEMCETWFHIYTIKMKSSTIFHKGNYDVQLQAILILGLNVQAPV